MKLFKIIRQAPLKSARLGRPMALFTVMFFSLLVLVFLSGPSSAQKTRQPLQGIAILIDPGHGGLALGAHFDTVEEKQITLSVATKLKAYLEAQGARVLMTRLTDVDVSLEERVNQSIALRPDIFISVHANANTHSSMYGIETYYCGRRSSALARSLLRSVSNGLGEKANWAQQDNLFVLHHNIVPSSLVEIGYLSNARTVRLLVQDAYQERAAASICDGVLKYFAAKNAARGCALTPREVAQVVARMKKAVAKAARQGVDRGYLIPVRSSGGRGVKVARHGIGAAGAI